MDFEDFDSVFAFDADVVYGESVRHKIEKNRRSMEGGLFIDRLLKTLGINEPGNNIYPPKSNQSLRQLHQQIIDSPSPDHHRQSVLYYVLRDLSRTDKDSHHASNFAKSVFLPEKYRIFIDGVWYLDRARFEKALDYLTEPVLIPTFPEEIVYALCTHPDQHDMHIPLAYYYAVSPPVTSPKVLEALYVKMAESSVTEALFWSRKQGPSMRRRLFDQLIHNVLDAPEGNDRARRSIELIHLPFDTEEEQWFLAYLTEGQGRNIPRAKDALNGRAVAKGRSDALAELGKGFGSTANSGMEWSGSSFEHGLMTPPR
ncbi:MAG: hypothetical protein Q9183_004078 [Haloplaca sp. 2 TL-2023]